MREFGDRFGEFERIDLGTTFRCADRISEIATKFVLRNPAQIRKTVKGDAQGRGAGGACGPSRQGRCLGC